MEGAFRQLEAEHRPDEVGDRPRGGRGVVMRHGAETRVERALVESEHGLCETQHSRHSGLVRRIRVDLLERWRRHDLEWGRQGDDAMMAVKVHSDLVDAELPRKKMLSELDGSLFLVLALDPLPQPSTRDVGRSVARVGALAVDGNPVLGGVFCGGGPLDDDGLTQRVARLGEAEAVMAAGGGVGLLGHAVNDIAGDAAKRVLDAVDLVLDLDVGHPLLDLRRRLPQLANRSVKALVELTDGLDLHDLVLDGHHGPRLGTQLLPVDALHVRRLHQRDKRNARRLRQHRQDPDNDRVGHERHAVEGRVPQDLLRVVEEAVDAAVLGAERGTGDDEEVAVEPAVLLDHVEDLERRPEVQRDEQQAHNAPQQRGARRQVGQLREFEEGEEKGEVGHREARVVNALPAVECVPGGATQLNEPTREPFGGALFVEQDPEADGVHKAPEHAVCDHGERGEKQGGEGGLGNQNDRQ
mmetsp:Transcript_25508/g.60224  ORF Transcript_25508/g.60224 Transcript_25508/m.60224 type:complete len:469 (-) Transcript_25508:1038-2444(-)